VVGATGRSAQKYPRNLRRTLEFLTEFIHLGHNRRVKNWAHIFSGFLLVLNSSQSLAKPKGAQSPDEIERVLSYLIGSATAIPPKDSGCFDLARPSRNLGDVIAMEIATFASGKNQVKGKCAGKAPEACEFDVTHENGEDVSDARFSFEVSSGKLDPSSLHCVLTP
jgi:hypothetical protein